MEYINVVENSSLDIELYHPVKELLFYLQKSDSALINQWSNYGNSDYFGELFLQGNLSDFRYRNEFQIDSIRKQFQINDLNNNWEHLEENSINFLQLVINNVDRIDLLPYNYFRLIQPFQHHIGTINYPFNEYFLVAPYSFSIEPDEFQPSGSSNFSNSKRAQINIHSKRPPLEEVLKITYYNIVCNDQDITSNYRNPDFNTNVNISNTNSQLLNVTSLDSSNINNKIIYGTYTIETVNNNVLTKAIYPMMITNVKYNVGSNNYIILNNLIILTGATITLFTDNNKQTIFKTCFITNGEFRFIYIDPRISMYFELNFISLQTNIVEFQTIVRNISETDYINLIKCFPFFLTPPDNLIDPKTCKIITPSNNTINTFTFFNIDKVNSRIYGKLTVPTQPLKQFNIIIRYGNSFTKENKTIIPLLNAPITLYRIDDKLWANPINMTPVLTISEQCILIITKINNTIIDPVNPINFLWKYILFVHSINYNRLIIENGIGSIEYSY